MDKHDYEKSFGKIQRFQQERMIAFWKNIPFFKAWTQVALSKLNYFFKKVQYKAGQTVYRVGQDCTHIYIVYSGEFEQSYPLKIQRNEIFDHKKYILSGLLETQSKRHKIKSVQNSINYRCCIMGQGQIMGEEDAIRLVNYTKNVKCKSQQGELLVMTIQDFF